MTRNNYEKKLRIWMLALVVWFVIWLAIIIAYLVVSCLGLKEAQSVMSMMMSIGGLVIVLLNCKILTMIRKRNQAVLADLEKLLDIKVETLTSQQRIDTMGLPKK